MVADVLRGPPPDPWHLAPEPFPLLVEPPHQRGQPGETTFDQGHPQPRELVEHAFDDQTDHLRLEGLGHAGVLFDIVGRPAARGWWVAGRAAEVEANRQAMALGGGIDRVVAPISIERRRAYRQKDLDKARMVA